MSEVSNAQGGDIGLDDALRRLGLLDVGASARWTPLVGGVSSDIWRVDLSDRSVCLKRARSVLAVKAEWHAPVERSGFEVAWLNAVRAVEPDAVPIILGHLPDEHLFVMEYFEPSEYRIWKDDLSSGRVDVRFAGDVGRVLGNIHGHFAGDDGTAERFATDDLFHSLRLAPYLLSTAEAHPDLAPVLEGLAERTAETRLTLVHGDVSPKNILVGPKGPVLLDAECAWYGDPAFDVAFCLTHLLLKCHWVPGQQAALFQSIEAFRSGYATSVSWESDADFDGRVATLLPALLLARVDGKSPVDYLSVGDRDRVRRVSHDLLLNADQSLGERLEIWKRSLAQ